MGKQILLKENREKADAKILKIEQEYVSKVTDLKAKLHALGIDEVSKEMLLAIIAGNTEIVREKVLEICGKDIDSATSPIAKEQVKNAINAKLSEFRMYALKTFAEGHFKNADLDLQSIKSIFEIGENGLAFIPEEKKEIIREGFKEYLEGDPDKIKAFELHQETAKKMDAMVKAFIKADLIPGMYIGNPTYFGNMFRFKQDEKTGEWGVTPAELNMQSYRDYQSMLTGEESKL